MQGDGASDLGDPFDLNRFISSQEGIYDRALAELRDGLGTDEGQVYTV